MATNNNPKKLTRGKDKKLSGVCSGIAEYFDWDVTLVRLLMAVFIVATGLFPGVVFYVIAAMIMPEGAPNA